MPLRVAAIDFLNPAPLMWDFYHAPHARRMARAYELHPMRPAACARALLAGDADLGLIPVAALTPELRIVPGCAIASLHRVRSIQLIVKDGLALEDVRTVAVDTASRSSVAYVQVLFRHFLKRSPSFRKAEPDVPAMLAQADAALIIGDPALVALERRAEIEAVTGLCTWHDVAELWHAHTGMPWVAAVWSVRPAAVPAPADRTRLVDDLNGSRDRGLASIPALVEEWCSRIALPAATIHTYLTENIHYRLDRPALEAIVTFRELATSVQALPCLPSLPLL